MTQQKTAIFTICSNNYMPMARVFLDSARSNLPAADLFVCLVDRIVAIEGLYGDVAEIVTLEHLAIPDLPGFTFRYDVMELNTAAKPFMFLHLFEERGYERVLYFDPDIEIFTSLDSVMTPLAEGASFVLTPHVLQPAEGPEEPNDLSFLRAGTYNLGFLGAAGTQEARDVLQWWARRLLHQCVNDQQAGLFVDQKFVDLIPGFVSAIAILRDSSLNVAYWNLSQRAFAQEGEGWTVDGKPLGFFHYSGFNPRTPRRLSKHTTLFKDEHGTALAALLASYAERLLALGHGNVAHGTYAYGRFASGTPIPDIVRRMFRERHAGWPTDPFETFEAHLHRPWPGTQVGDARAVVTNFIAYLHSVMPYLQSCMDINSLHGQNLLIDWFVKHAARDLKLDARLVEPVALRWTDTLPQNMAHGVQDQHGDISVIGYLRTTSGVGEVARATLAALAQTDLRVDGCDVSLNVVADRSDHAADAWLAERPAGKLRLFSVNADQLPLVLEHLRPVLERPAYQVAMPFWELSEFPDEWLPAFDEIDEIWAPSRYIQLMLARKLHKPVLYMPRALGPQTVSPLKRPAFGLPERRFLFFFAFDFLSFAERKNPAGVIEAFRKTLKTSGSARPALVIKALNGALAPESLHALREQIQQDPDIFLIERTLTRPEMAALVWLCDGVVSLHRAEGFGLLVAEAMQLGRPVIATDYASTTELVSPATGYPVEYKLIPVAPGAYPFARGQVWADPDLDHAAWLMARLAAEPDAAAARVAAARTHIATNYSPAHAAERMRARLRELNL